MVLHPMPVAPNFTRENRSSLDPMPRYSVGPCFSCNFEECGLRSSKVRGRHELLATALTPFDVVANAVTLKSVRCLPRLGDAYSHF